jgi:hypothetical protein
MFRFEKDMIPVLRKSLSHIYKTQYFVEEFSSGIGIADLVFTTKITKRDKVLLDFQAMYYINQYFNKKPKNISKDDFIKLYSLNRKKAELTISFLRCLGLIKDFENGTFSMQGLFTPSTRELYSIEAKIKDWKQGLFQAIRYKNYSQKTFLAISEQFIHRVDESLLLKNNVGLISVNCNEARIIINPKKNIPSNKTAFYHLSENFASKMIC